jgi:hypothetical protein
MEPLAVTLDQLQGDQNCFNGMLLPNLVQLRRQLNVYAGEQLIYCTPLVKCILTGLETRYNSMFNFDLSVPEAKDAIFAGVSHPQFKLKWVPPRPVARGQGALPPSCPSLPPAGPSGLGAAPKGSEERACRGSGY